MESHVVEPLMIFDDVIKNSRVRISFVKKWFIDQQCSCLQLQQFGTLNYNNYSTHDTVTAFGNLELDCGGSVYLYHDILNRRKKIEIVYVEHFILFQEEIQTAFTAYDKEQKSKKAVDTMREKNPSDRHKLVSLFELFSQKPNIQ